MAWRPFSANGTQTCATCQSGNPGRAGYSNTEKEPSAVHLHRWGQSYSLRVLRRVGGRMAYALGLLSAIVPGYVSRALRGLTFSGRGAGLRQHICCIGETVVQATAIYCLLDT